jgi:hypothetical protein
MTETQEDIQYKVTRTFRDNVLKWVEIDDTLKAIRSKIKDLTDEKKQHEENIIGYLTKVDEESIRIKDGKLTKNISKTKAPLKKELIHKSLVELIGDSNKAMTMTEHIINNRPTVERVKLSRSKNKKSIK